VASHTNSLAGASTTWNALCKQFGVIQVNNLNELADLLLAFLYLSVPEGRNVGIIGIGGGASVQAADDCNAVGLFVPPLPQETKAELKKFTPKAGTSINNPIDSSMMFSPEECYRTIKITAACPSIDLLILYLLLDWPLRDSEGLNMVDAVIDSMISAGKASEKPIAIVLNSSGALPAWQGVLQLQEKCLQAGFPVFNTVGGAALAISRFIQYQENRERYHND
jgi:acyl-CoA synthetase (NDP forming)